MRFDIAGAAGVGVVAPGAAHVVGALQQHEIFFALLAQLHPHAQARKPGAHDDDAVSLNTYSGAFAAARRLLEFVRLHKTFKGNGL
jgi:hypothetical protein